MLSYVAASRSAFRLGVVIYKFIFSQRLSQKWTSTSKSCLTASTKSWPTHVLLQLPQGPQLLQDESIGGSGNGEMRTDPDQNYSTLASSEDGR